MPRIVGERYEVGRRLGAGGMAKVFEAYDQRLRRRVAIKFLRVETLDATARRRFELEARTGASFTHPDAVVVHDVGEDGNHPYLVMELVEGPTLAEVLHQRGRLEPDAAVAIIAHVLAALDAAHRHGVVHRDVKPSNILGCGNTNAKLADFGIAKALADANASMTATGQVLGTPRYLSPEQVSGHAASPRSDVYAAGVVLYEMLAGHAPFTGGTPLEIAVAHQRAPVPPLSIARAGLDRSLLDAVERALEKGPERRFPSADAMRRALVAGTSADRTVAGAVLPRPVHTRAMPVPTGATRPDHRRIRRRFGLAAGGAAALAAVIAAVVALTGNDLRPRAETNESVPTSAPAAAVAQSTTTARPTTTTARPTATSARAPQNWTELVTLLAANPAAYGARADDLFNRLRDFQQTATVMRGEEEVAELARDIIMETDEWMADAELDAQIGVLAQQLLQPYAIAAPSDPGGDDDD